jgi:hypothetical protein
MPTTGDSWMVDRVARARARARAHPTRLSVLKESSSCWSSLWKIAAPIAGRFPAYLHSSHKPASELEQRASLRSTPERLGARVGRVALERAREDEDARVVAALNQVLREYAKRLRKRANAHPLTTAARKQGSAHKSGGRPAPRATTVPGTLLCETLRSPAWPPARPVRLP